MKPYFLSRKSQIDLTEIWSYTVGKWSVAQAEEYYNAIIDTIEGIAKGQEKGKPYHYHKLAYCFIKVNAHFVFYIETESNLTVIRILHEKMDLLSHLTQP